MAHWARPTTAKSRYSLVTSEISPWGLSLPVHGQGGIGPILPAALGQNKTDCLVVSPVPGRRHLEGLLAAGRGPSPDSSLERTGGKQISQSASIPTDDAHESLVPIRRARDAKGLPRGTGWWEGHWDN